ALVQGSLAVPGLPVVSVAWDDADDDGQGVTVVQRLPSGDPLTLRYTPLTAATASLTDRRAPGPGAGDPIAAPDAEVLDQAPRDAEADRSVEVAGSLQDAEAEQAADSAQSATDPRATPRTAPEASPDTGAVTLRHGPWMLEATAPVQSDSVRAILNQLLLLP
ncbi:MAG: hypothetical protein ACOC5J_00190, partial [Gemmatimonadota bacterium]